MHAQSGVCVAAPEPTTSYWGYLGPILGLLVVIIILIIVLLKVKLVHFRRKHGHSRHRHYAGSSSSSRIHQVMTPGEIPADLDLNHGFVAARANAPARLSQRNEQAIIQTKDGLRTLRSNKPALASTVRGAHSQKHRSHRENKKQRASKETELI